MCRDQTGSTSELILSEEKCGEIGKNPSPGVGFSLLRCRHIRPCNHSIVQVTVNLNEHVPIVTQAIQCDVAGQSQPSQLSALYVFWYARSSLPSLSDSVSAESSRITGKGCEGKH